jgi:hypothetical protein
MNTPILNRFQMRSILRHLDAAMVASRKDDSPENEGAATWNIRVARDYLLEAALADVAVETPEPARVLEPVPA